MARGVLRLKFRTGRGPGEEGIPGRVEKDFFLHVRSKVEEALEHLSGSVGV